VVVAVSAHTHPALGEEGKGIVLVNPGSPNDRRFSDRLSYAVLDIEEGEVRPRIIWL
jgi:predicted phosphodiesterase